MRHGCRGSGEASPGWACLVHLAVSGSPGQPPLGPRETEARLPPGRATAETAVPQGAAGSAPPTSSGGAAWGPRPPGPGLTQAQQHRAHLSQAATPGRRGALGRVPGEAGAQQPRVHELPAERLGLGYQLLLGGRAVKGIHDLRGENRGAPQHLHGGDASEGSRTCGQTALSPAWLAKGEAGPARRAGSGARDGERCAPRSRPRPCRSARRGRAGRGSGKGRGQLRVTVRFCATSL